MIETLHTIATKAGMKSVNVSIQSESETKTCVTIQCIPHPLKEKAGDEVVALRDVLARPLIVKGLPGEIEAKLSEHLSDYLNTVIPHMTSLETQIVDLGKDAKSAGKKNDENSSDDKGKGKGKGKADDPKLEDESAAESRFTDSNTSSL